MDVTVQTPRQLAQVLRGRRAFLKMTQKQAASRVGLLPKTISAMESAPERSTIATLFALLSALQLEVALRPRDAGAARRKDEW